MTLTKPKFQARTIDLSQQLELEKMGINPLLARILAARPKARGASWQQILEPKLANLSNPSHMQDMDRASERLAQAIVNQEVIGIETDHDCDGQTAHAVIYHNLVKHFQHSPDLIRSYIGHRLQEGYGLSAKVAARILADKPRPTLIITADNGSSDEPRIAMLRSEGIDVIVSDHHQLPIAGPPASAYACLNPTRSDCEYGDPYIAGCMVAWLLMSVTRLRLIELGYLPSTAPKLSDSLDYVALGTIADCVSMAQSINNRIVVSYGLELINAAVKPCWQALKLQLKQQLKSLDLGFKVGPLLNSDGRLDSALGSVSFLLAKDLDEANNWIQHLQEQNAARKLIQARVTNLAHVEAIKQVEAGKFGICVFMQEGHAGVHGISASRLKDYYGRPTVLLAPKSHEEGVITGSVRGIANFDVGRAISWLMTEHPGLLIAGGGHHGAGGVSLLHSNYQRFAESFEQAVRQQLELADIGPVLLTDGVIQPEWLELENTRMLAKLEPFGREFEFPSFELTARLANFRVIGDGTHARVELVYASRKIGGVWFGFRANSDAPIPVHIGREVRACVSLQVSDFGGVSRTELLIDHMLEV